MGRNDPMRNHLGRIRIEANLQRHPATFPYMIFLHRWSFCVGDLFASVFVLSVAVIVRFAIESFCSTFVVYYVIETVSFTMTTVRSSILICSMNIIVCFAKMYFLPYPPPINIPYGDIVLVLVTDVTKMHVPLRCAICKFHVFKDCTVYS